MENGILYSYKAFYLPESHFLQENCPDRIFLTFFMPNSHFMQIRCSSADVCETPSQSAHMYTSLYLVTLVVLGVRKDGTGSEVL